MDLTLDKHELVHLKTPGARELAHLEEQLFALRENVEVIWLEMGRLCSTIVDQKLYRFARDEDGNYFRTAQRYFAHLDKRFHERGWDMSRTTLNRWMGTYKLFIEDLHMTPEECRLLGKTNLDLLAPAVRKLRDEGKPEEADALVTEMMAVVYQTQSLPSKVVTEAVDEVTGRVTKGLEVRFQHGAIGQRLVGLTLWWGERPIDLFKSEISAEQMQWVMRRLGQKPRED